MKNTTYKKIALSLALSLSLYAQDSFNLEKQSLESAIKQIASKSNMPYLVDGNLLKGKTAPKIENIDGAKNALDKILEGSGLEAIIENETIIIKQKPTSGIYGKGTYLDEISVSGKSSKSGSAESGYLVEDVKTLGVWGDLSLQDTPYSMSVVPQEFIENTITSDFTEVTKRNPLLQESAMGYQTGLGISTSIRGFGISSALLDGIPLKSAYWGYGTEEVDRIEVLSGTTGFLYGAGNVGGTINYALKYPTATPFTKVSIGNNGGQNYFTSVDTSQKINDKLAVRVNGSYTDGDKVKENSSRETKYIGVAVDYKPTDNLYLGTLYSYRDDIRHGSADDVASLTGAMPNAKEFDNKKSYAPDWTKGRVKSDKIELKAEYNFTDSIKLRGKYFYMESDMDNLYISSNINTNTNKYSYQISTFDTQTGKYDGAYLYLDNEFSLGWTEHFLTLGGNFGRDEFHLPNSFYWGPTTIVSSPSDFQDAKMPNIPPRVSGTYKGRENMNYNYMLGDHITFNEQWSALVGANYATIYNKSFNKQGKVSGSYKDSKLTPTISLIYKPFEDLTTYATYMEALENGKIINDEKDTNDGEVFEPTTSKQYEIGAKWSIREDLLLSSALFRIERVSFLTEKFADNGNGKTQTTTQNGLQVNEGIEVLATGKATDNLTLVGGVTYVSPKIENATDKKTEGKDATSVAKVQAKLYAEYRLPVSPKIFLNGGVYYTGAKWKDNINTQKIPSHATADLGIRYETKLDGYDTTFRLFVSNITDETYWASSISLGDPRTIGFSATMKF